MSCTFSEPIASPSAPDVAATAALRASLGGERRVGGGRGETLSLADFEILVTGLPNLESQSEEVSNETHCEAS